MFEATGVIVSVSETDHSSLESFKSAIEDKLLAGSVQEAAGAVVPASETDHSSSKSFKFAKLDWFWC